VFGKDSSASDGQSLRDRLAERLGPEAGKSVFFHGHVSRENLFQELSDARAAVFPSYAEAFAIAPLEAMARGCPTIYGERCSGPEAIEHGTHGLLVDPDEPQAIASAIIRVLEDDQLAERLGMAASDRVRERFSLNVILKQNVACYRDCIAQFRVRRGESSHTLERATGSCRLSTRQG
jgi:glycosyltransferase involved in cell wall biosynthesis